MLKGSRRPPQRDLVRRTPLTTASTRPSSRVNRRDDAVGLSQRPRAEHDGPRLLGSAPISRLLAREHDPRRAAEVGAHVDVLEASGAGEQREHLDDLALVDLHGQRAVRLQERRRAGDDALVELQAVVAAEQRHVRLVVTHLGSQATQRVLGHVGRVGDDHVEARPAGQVVVQVADQELDAVLQTQPDGVPAGHLQRRRIDVGAHHTHRRMLGCQRQGDVARAGADVERPRARPCRPA